ncbi:Granzyme A [Merluccius polli]|uniref:Granzyme A n=1 Tax=Merluccius polli TaxID=89951 RepID=A0AA47M866_MERPO|nr:Granzyme A [Merluccius polli]
MGWRVKRSHISEKWFVVFSPPELWDVETARAVGGSILGHIHHHDPRAPKPLVGAAVQQGSVCSLQWSPGEDRLASGSKDGRLSIWDGDFAACKLAKLQRQPLVTMKQPSAVKKQRAMACSCLALFTTVCLVLLYVQSCVCGEAEIFGGKEVKAHSMPYMVLLLHCGEPDCGGTLLSSRWVLTAAHCTDITAVLLGVHSIKKIKNDKSVQVRKVVKTYPHPEYDSDTFNHDLQLLKLKKEVKQTNTVKYLPLADVIEDPNEGTTCRVAGWGFFDNTNTTSDVLMSAKVDVMGREKCNSATYWNSDITPDMVCAGPQGKNKTQDTCEGDSGGPLFCNGVQVGVTSFGAAGCRPHKIPGVYTFLSKQHIEWMKKIMRKPALFETSATQ